jgi:hypothetical protein
MFCCVVKKESGNYSVIFQGVRHGKAGAVFGIYGLCGKVYRASVDVMGEMTSTYRKYTDF